MKIPFAKPEITKEDVQDINNFLLNCDGRLTQGEKTYSFEKRFEEYIGGGYCLATSSCMSALIMSYLALGIGRGDKVIVPAMSHVATAHAVEMVSATPVFVDCNENGNIDYRLIEDLLWYDRGIKAISVVHYLGNMVQMKAICDLACDYNLSIIEDCALALGSRLDNKHSGLWGSCGAFSFYPTKQLPIGEGGMFVTKDYDLYKRAKAIRTFGKTEGGNAEYNIGLLGANFRMTEMQAVLGVSKLKGVDKELKIRGENLDRLKREFNIISPVGNVPSVMRIFGGSYCAILNCKNKEDRTAKRNILQKEGIETSIYYPHPISRLKYYRDKYGYAPIRYKNAEYIADCTIALPIGSHADMDYMIGVLKEII